MLLRRITFALRRDGLIFRPPAHAVGHRDVNEESKCHKPATPCPHGAVGYTHAEGERVLSAYSDDAQGRQIVPMRGPGDITEQ